VLIEQVFKALPWKTLCHFFKESVMWAGIFEQVVGQMHKKVLKTMVMPLFYQKQPTFFVFSLQDYKKEERKEDDASVRSKMNIATLIKV
jgi:hypothetical protein